MVSPTTRAHLRCGDSGRSPMRSIEYRMRRCTGLSPSRTSGMARDVITDSEYARNDSDTSSVIGVSRTSPANGRPAAGPGRRRGLIGRLSLRGSRCLGLVLGGEYPASSPPGRRRVGNAGARRCGRTGFGSRRHAGQVGVRRSATEPHGWRPPRDRGPFEHRWTRSRVMLVDPADPRGPVRSPVQNLLTFRAVSKWHLRYITIHRQLLLRAIA